MSRGILIICVPLIMPRRGKLRLTRAKRGQWGCPENHDFLFCQLKTKIVNGNNFSQKRKSQFSFLPSICRRAYAERENLRALYNKRALKRRAKRENRRSAAKPRARGFSLKSSESQHLFCEIRAKDKINNSRKQNRAFALAHPYLQKLLLLQER